MRVAVIENGTVTNIIEADLATVMPPDGQLWVASDAAARGDLYDGVQFTRPPAPRFVPDEVTMRQAQQALVIAGLLDMVQPLIDAIPDPINRQLAQIEWNKSQTVKRGRPLTVQIGTGLGLSLEQMDDMLVFANTLP